MNDQEKLPEGFAEDLAALARVYRELQALRQEEPARSTADANA